MKTQNVFDLPDNRACYTPDPEHHHFLKNQPFLSIDLAISLRGTRLNGVSLHNKFGPFMDNTSLDLFGSMDKRSRIWEAGGDQPPPKLN